MVIRDGRTSLQDNTHRASEITIRYPKWVRTGAAPQEPAEKWDGYLASITEHEQGHRDTVAVEDLTRAVALLPAAPTSTGGSGPCVMNGWRS
ncbi:MAG: DUF922 domain-containing Zn-dependent protease [Nitrospirae bacterium]|nr:DUF922 domain-containing Zn-dependent protease [Nitrospirota bacterium]NTW66589.1 DUF922 domain-containing Zn-dependent protease [Nitrospirota bacterium]